MKNQGNDSDQQSISRIDRLQPHVDKVLQAIGRSGPIVTEMTTLHHFYHDLNESHYTEEVNHLQGLLGFVVQRNDLIVDIAERLADYERPAPSVEDLADLQPFR